MMRAFLALLLLSGTAPVAAETVAITNARILTMGPAGTVDHGAILIEDGVVKAIGKIGTFPQDARVIDAAGGVVTSGFIQSDSTLAAVEVSQVPASSDRAAHSARLSAGFDISLGMNPDSALLPVSRLAGITHAVAVPVYDGDAKHRMQFAGQAAVIDLAQRPDMVVRSKVAMVLQLGEGGAARVGGARGAAVVALRGTLADVRHFVKHRALYERGLGRPLGLSRIDIEALIPVVTGKMPLIVKVDRAPDIVEMLALAREEKLRIILDGAAEGWRVSKEIAAQNVPVILDPYANLPRSFSEIGARQDNAALLHGAGVKIALKAGSGVAHRARELRYGAGNAVAWGVAPRRRDRCHYDKPGGDFQPIRSHRAHRCRRQGEPCRLERRSAGTAFPAGRGVRGRKCHAAHSAAARTRRTLFGRQGNPSELMKGLS